MAGSVNKVILIGNLGRDPELKSFESGGSVISFPLATTETYRNRESGERITLPTDWHSIVIRKPGLVKIAESYLRKGDRVYLEGKVRYRTYEKDGQTRYITEIQVEELTLLSSREPGNRPESGVSSGGGHQADTPDADDLPF
ncbi:MAG: single-stranded DNA-binding protein [Flavobacteriales bacterium]|nr:single-stranded DNA-binding protein [Flavobacteriales bacterium]